LIMRLLMFRLLSLLLVLLFAGEALSAEEIRAIWVARWDYAKGTDPEFQKERIREIFERASRSGFNVVFFQVRGRADAFYRSSYEPWAMELSGRLGGDPGWDPLRFAAAEARRRGVELHAWVNVCTVWSGRRPPPLDTVPLHMWWAHPEWVLGGSASPGSVGYSFVNPAIPEVRGYLSSVISEIAERYDIDGVHLDYVRYPGPGFPCDRLSDRLYRDAAEAEPGLSRAEWQRRQVTELVRVISEAVRRVKPGLRISAAVLGRYSGFPGSWNGYNSVFQDARTWLREGLIDFIVPMIYNPGSLRSFGDILSDWIRESPGLPVCAGIDVKSCFSFDDLSSRIREARSLGASGVALFGYGSMEERGWWERLSSGEFAQRVAAPPMSGGKAPVGPGFVTVRKITADKVLVIWLPPEEHPSRYNIYRSESYPVDPHSPGTSVHTVSGRINLWVDRINPWSNYYYAVSSVDGIGVESPLCQQHPPVGSRLTEAGLRGLRIFPLEEEGVRISSPTADIGGTCDP